jgi:hypothetical protein
LVQALLVEKIPDDNTALILLLSDAGLRMYEALNLRVPKLKNLEAASRLKVKAERW